VLPVFRADSVVLAISAEKDGNAGGLRPDFVLAISAEKDGNAGGLRQVLKLRWRGPTRRYVSRWGERGASMSSSHHRAAVVTRHARFSSAR
jgi:hypothetical protein